MENREIRQHPEGIPVLGDVFLFQSLQDLKTKRVKVDAFLPSASTDNFEWVSQKAEDGDYDTDDLVTYEGAFYQSAIDDNPDVPGETANWVLRATSYSGFVLWQAGIFTGDEVFTMYKIEVESLLGLDSAVYLFRLKSAVRPYDSTDFLSELSGGDWELVGRILTTVVDTVDVSNIIVLDFANLQEMDFVQGSDVTSGKEIQVFNVVEGSRGSFVFTVDGLHPLTLPVMTKIVSPSNAEWAPPDWIPLEPGEYEMFLRFSNNQLRIKIEGPYI